MAADLHLHFVVYNATKVGPKVDLREAVELRKAAHLRGDPNPRKLDDLHSILLYQLLVFPLSSSRERDEVSIAAIAIK